MSLCREPLQGLIAAPVTPYDTQGQINPDIIAPYASLLKTAGVSGVFVNGTTGEGVLLSLEERMALAEVWVEQATPDFKVIEVIVHVAHTCAEDMWQAVRQAQARQTFTA